MTEIKHDTQVYLKPNVVFEPNVDNWYAWSHLISPATFAMNIVGRHLNIMTSYIASPKIHMEAVKDSNLLGGPFMDYEGNKVDEVKKMIKDTLIGCKDLIGLAKAIKKLNSIIVEGAKGKCIEEFYELIPKPLKGLVELVYDLNNQPSFRFYEALLYKSKYYNEDLQSMAIYLTEQDERPFALSTPRLKNDNDVFRYKMPFFDEKWDVLFEMSYNSKPYSEVYELFNPKDEALFKNFFTDKIKRDYEPYYGKGIRTRYFGHACILVESPELCILTDPVISYHGFSSEVGRYTYSDLPDEIDYVLITHNHQDHILLETMLRLRHKIKNIVVPRNGSGTLEDPSLKQMFKVLGFRNVIDLDEFEEIINTDLIITSVPFIGEHCDLNIRTKACYHVNLRGYKLMFMADSCNVQPEIYERTHRVMGDIDVLFLGMECDGAPMSWIYGPLVLKEVTREEDQSRRLKGSNYYEGKSVVEIFKPRDVYIYAMGQEPWLNYIMCLEYTEKSNPIIASNKLLAKCMEEGKTAERLFGEKEIIYEM